MNDKKKMAELIAECFHKCLSRSCTKCEYIDRPATRLGNRSCQAYLFADHLIANGVTVQGATDNDVAYKLKATDTVKPNDDVRSHRVKLDINNLFRQIDDLLSKIEEEDLEKTVFGVGVGLELLISYLRLIAIRAIELDDDVLIGLLFDLHVLNKEG